MIHLSMRKSHASHLLSMYYLIDVCESDIENIDQIHEFVMSWMFRRQYVVDAKTLFYNICRMRMDDQICYE